MRMMMILILRCIRKDLSQMLGIQIYTLCGSLFNQQVGPLNFLRVSVVNVSGQVFHSELHLHVLELLKSKVAEYIYMFLTYE